MKRHKPIKIKHRKSREMQRKAERKIQYGFHHPEQHNPHPEIKVGGRYLENAGFGIGDIVTVVVTKNEILIRKINKEKSA